MLNEPTYLLKDKNITKLIGNFILQGAATFSALDDIDKEELTIMAMSNLKGDAYTVIINADDFDSTLKYMMRFIHSGDSYDALMLAETMRANAIQYFAEDFEYVFNELKE